MRSARCLTKALQAQLNAIAGFDSQRAACSINSAARLYSSATSSIHVIQNSGGLNYNSGSHASHFVLPTQQLTSLLTSTHARSFSSGDDSSDLSSSPGFTDEAIGDNSEFGPSAILNAVAGVEDDSWLAAREDVWFFNRYMQSVLRFAQEATGLPWWEICCCNCRAYTYMNMIIDAVPCAGGKPLQSPL